jgi:uncharacterized protein
LRAAFINLAPRPKNGFPALQNQTIGVNLPANFEKGDRVKGFSVNIIGLSNKAHTFEFQLDDSFFGRYGTEIVSSGRLDAVVVLDKHETFIEADFSIKGHVRVTCDRSLEPFDEPLDIHKKMMFKYGETPGEISDEIVVIARDASALELGQPMYEFIAVSMPIKKLHPKFRAEESGAEGEEGRIVYTASTDTGKDEDGDGDIDPRWEALKKLK